MYRNIMDGGDTRVPADLDPPQPVSVIVIDPIPSRNNKIFNPQGINLFNSRFNYTKDNYLHSFKHLPYLLLFEGVVQSPYIPYQDLHDQRVRENPLSVKAPLSWSPKIPFPLSLAVRAFPKPPTKLLEISKKGLPHSQPLSHYCQWLQKNLITEPLPPYFWSWACLKAFELFYQIHCLYVQDEKVA